MTEWIKNTGTQPVDDGTVVQVKYNASSIFVNAQNLAEELDWSLTGVDDDIITIGFWRLVSN